MTSNPKICLLGDMVHHFYLKPLSEIPLLEGEKDRYKVFSRRTGAPIIRCMFYEALGSYECELSDIVPCYNFEKDKDNVWGPHEIDVLTYYSKTSRNIQQENKVLRVKEDAAYFASEIINAEDDCTLSFQSNVGCGSSSRSKDGKENFLNLREFLSSEDSLKLKNPKIHKILVLYDRNEDLRKSIKNFNHDVDSKKKLQELAANATGGVVIAIRHNINETDWLKTLKKTLNTQNNNIERREHCIVIVTSDELRKCGLNITERATIEQNIQEVVKCLDLDPRAIALSPH